MAAKLSDTDRLCPDSGFEESAFDETLCGTYSGSALQQQLETACRQGNGQELSRIVQALERAGEDVPSVLNARRGKNANTFLHLAVAKGSVECVKQLLWKGADCLQKNKGGRTSLNLVESSQSKATGRKGAYIVRVLQSAAIIRAVQINSPELDHFLKIPNSYLEPDCLQRALQEAIRKNDSVCAGKLVVKGHLTLDLKDALCHAKKTQSYAVHALLLMVVAAFDNDHHLVLSLLGQEVPENCQNPVVANPAFTHLQEAVCRSASITAVPIEIARHYNSVDVRRELLLSTGVNHEKGNVVWHNLHLTELEVNWLKEIQWVQKLVLSNNNLLSFPASAGRYLKQVTTINLQSNLLREIPASLLELPCIQDLNLSHNRLQEIPEVFEWSSSLAILDLSHNDLDSFPQSCEAPNLRSLNLSYNCFQEVPLRICYFSSLDSLDLSHNPNITKLPTDMGRLQNLFALKLEGMSKLKFPPKSIYCDTSVCITYLNSKLRSTRGYYRMKLILCGKQERGKTTLVARLQGKDVKESDNQSTVGIDVSEWRFSPGIGKQAFTFNIWDFGGQEEYYATHQCFLTERSLYLLLWNITHGEKGVRELKPWLDNIALRAPNSKVIIVATFYDRVPEEDRQDGGHVDQLLMQVASLASVYQPTLQVKRMTCIGLHGALHNVDLLKHIIYEEADSYVISGEKVMGRLIPASYHALDSHLAQVQKEVRQDRRSPIMHASEFTEMIRSLGLADISTAAEVKAATLFLHEVGSLLHYDDRKNKLDDLYFVDPRWLCDMMSVIVTVKERNPFIRNGIIDHSYLPLLYRGKQFPSEFLDQYLVLLDRFEVALPLDQAKHRILIPSLLPDICPDDTDRPSDRKVCYGRQILFPISTPPGFWSRLLTRMMHSVKCVSDLLRPVNVSTSPAVCMDNEQEMAISLGPAAFAPLVRRGDTVLKYWKSGIYFQSPETYLLVEELINVHSSSAYGVCVSATSDPIGCRAYGEVLDVVQGLVIDWYPGLLHTTELDQRILCFQCLTAGNSDPYVFSRESLVQYIKASSAHVPCSKGHNVALVDLIPDLLLADVDNSFLLEEGEVVFGRDTRQQLGKGGFGSVFHGQWKKQSVAVKVFHSRGHPIDALSELRTEAQLLQRTHHPSLVCMVGVLIFPRPCLVMEEAPMGSLEGPLIKHKLPISRIVLFRMAAQIASALKHLHSLSYIYRDLKASNVLLWSLDMDQLVNCKLADFGISTRVVPSGVKGRQGTLRFTAPEVLGSNRGQLIAYDCQADIFSYAMVLFQMTTRSLPFNQLKSVLISTEIQEGRRPRVSNFPPAHTSFHFMTGLMKRCWKHNPTDRPTTGEAIQYITSPRVQLTMGVHHIESRYSLRCVCVSNDLSAAPLCGDVDPNAYPIHPGLQFWVCCDNFEAVEVSVFEAYKMEQLQKPLVFEDRQVTSVAVCGDCMWMATRVGVGSGQLDLFSTSTHQRVHCIGFQDTVVSCITCDDTHVYVGTMEGCVYSYGLSLVDVQSAKQTLCCCLTEDCISSMVVFSSVLWVSQARQLLFWSTKTMQTESLAILPDSIPGSIGHLCAGTFRTSKDVQSLVWSAHLGGHTLCAWQTLQQTIKFTIDVGPTLLKVEPDAHPNDCVITAVCSALDTVWCGMITGHILVFSEEQDFLLHFQPYDHSVRFLTVVPSTGPCGKEECMVLSGGKRYLKNCYLEGVSDDAHAPDIPATAKEVRESTAGTVILWEALRACHMRQVRMLSNGDAWTSHEMINKYQKEWEESQQQVSRGNRQL